MTSYTQGQRIRIARRNKNLTQTQLAQAIGLSGHQVIQGYESDNYKNPNIDSLTKIAEVCDVSLIWIVTGDELSEIDSNNSKNLYGIRRYAPVLAWSDIRKLKKDNKYMNSAQFEERIPLLQEFGPSTYGLKIEDDSMQSNDASSDSFKKGDYIIIDPDVKKAIDDYVLVSFSDNDDPILRRLVLLPDGQAMLKALNKNFPDKAYNEDTIIYGVVVGMHRNYSRPIK